MKKITELLFNGMLAVLVSLTIFMCIVDYYITK